MNNHVNNPCFQSYNNFEFNTVYYPSMPSSVKLRVSHSEIAVVKPRASALMFFFLVFFLLTTLLIYHFQF